MDFSRRQLLQAAGAGAALGTVPVGVLASGGAVGAGEGLYAVVSQHATWGVYETFDMARHEAALICDAGLSSTNAVRCSPELARQFQLGKLGRFVEVNGWALTPEELDLRGGDYLRDAQHKSSARLQILEHCLNQLHDWFEAYEAASSPAWWNGVRLDDGAVVGVYDCPDRVPSGVHAYRCNVSLMQALRVYMDGGSSCPEIFDGRECHVLQSEHEQRRLTDVVYRLAIYGTDQRKDAAALIGPTDTRWVAVAQRTRWIFGAGHTQMQALEMAAGACASLNDEGVAVPASQTLARAVLANGYEIPPFWRIDQGLLCHEVELE